MKKIICCILAGFAALAATAAAGDLEKLPEADKDYRIKIEAFIKPGGKFWRAAEGKSIQVGEEGSGIIISFKTLESAPNDPGCCPSKKSQATYTFEPPPVYRLKELKE